MNACCSLPTGTARPCPACGAIGPIVGVAPVRPHRPGAPEGSWQHCATTACPVVYYIDADTVDVSEVVTQVGRKATDRPSPVCFCFAHTADDLLADAAAHEGVSTIKAQIKQAVNNGHCACEHLNPAKGCCLPEVHRVLRSRLARTPGV